MKPGMLVSLSALLLAGCVSVGNSSLLDEVMIGRIEVGQTTRAQVLALLGEPTERRSVTLRGSTAEWWAYSYATSVVNPLEYLLLVGLFINGIGLPDTQRELHVFMNADGIVTSIARQMTTYDLGGLFTPIKVSSQTMTTVGLQGRTGRPIQLKGQLQVEYP